MQTDQILLHHYPQSPVAEKVRVSFGIKGVTWKSVLIPRLPPKPNLMPLTGGYRLTPVMQIGSDVYCDSACIQMELERRFPQPLPNLDTAQETAQDMMWAGQPWHDGLLFKDAVTVALVEMSSTMPPEFLADRGPLYFGAEFSLDTLKANYDRSLSKIADQFGWMNERLESRAFMLGAQPSLQDARVYYLLWFLRDRMAHGAPFLSAFENLELWEQRIKDIGHGTCEDLSDLEALEIAKHTEPMTLKHAGANDLHGLNLGDKVTAQPISGGPRVAGTLHSLTTERLSILRHHDLVGNICVHFPRTGYLFKSAP